MTLPNTQQDLGLGDHCKKAPRAEMAYRLNLKVSKICSHAAMAAATKTNEGELRLFVFAPRLKEACVVVSVRCFEPPFSSMLYACRCAAYVTFWDDICFPVRICTMKGLAERIDDAKCLSCNAIVSSEPLLVNVCWNSGSKDGMYVGERRGNEKHSAQAY
jgi:hypothetical protein